MVVGRVVQEHGAFNCLIGHNSVQVLCLAMSLGTDPG